MGLQWAINIGLGGMAIEGHAVKDSLCREAHVKVVLASSKTGDRDSLDALDLATVVASVLVVLQVLDHFPG